MGWVSERLRRTAVGSRVLGELEANPGDPARQAEAARVLHEVTSQEPDGFQALDAAVAQVRIEQSSMVTGSAASGGAQVTVGPHGAITMPRGVIAGGDVNQSRVFQFRLGGRGLVLAAVAVFVVAVAATITYVVVLDRDRGSAGSGSGGGVTVSVSEVQFLTAHDSEAVLWPYIEPYTQYVSLVWEITNNSATEVRYDEDVNLYDSSGAEIEDVLAGPDFIDGCRETITTVVVEPGESVSSPGPICFDYGPVEQRPAEAEFVVATTPSDFGPFESIVVPLTEG